MVPPPRLLLAAAVAALSALGTATAADRELTLYTARHYQTDARLFAHFTKLTGIKVTCVEGGEDELFQRIVKEGATGPADVFITADAARMGEADALGLFARPESAILERRIPAELRTPTWFGFSTRARVIVYDRAKVKAAELQSYADLASPRFKGKVCVRSGTHPYNLSLGAALIARDGEPATEAWARGLVANLARAPKGGDTEQIRAVVDGECEAALVNSYYLVRMLRSGREEDRQVGRRVGVAWPDQKGSGTHVNISGGGVLKTAPHPEAAVKFLEYLVSDQAQAYIVESNNEWPVVKTVTWKNEALESLGKFKADPLAVGTLSANTARAQKLFERAGWR
jgi:iron(III) transport system substrate-binding protein